MQVTRRGDDDIAELEALLNEAPPVACHYSLQPQDECTGPFMPNAKLSKALKAWHAGFPSDPPHLTSLTTWNKAAWDDAGAWIALLR